MSSTEDFSDSSSGGGRLLMLIVALLIAAAIVWLVMNPVDTQASDNFLTHSITRDDLLVTVTEQGMLESSENVEIKCKVRGQNTVIWVVEGGTVVQEGDEVVKLDTLFMEEQIAERTKFALWTRSGCEQTRANYERAKLAVGEYEDGRFQVELMTLQKDKKIAEANLSSARNLHEHAKKMAESGYVSNLELEENEFAVKRAEMSVKLIQTRIDVLKNFTKGEELIRLKGDLRAAEAKLKAEEERVYADDHRLERAEGEMVHTIVKAPKTGMVIYPNAAQWKNAPEIEEGSTVHKDQTLLLMPDLGKMQVKVGIHESIVDRVKTGLRAVVTVSDRTIEGTVHTVASVTTPAGWWTGNQVKYDTIIRLPEGESLKPGMSAEVEVIIAEHIDVVTIPVAAVLETTTEQVCWVMTAAGPVRRVLKLGDSNDVAIVVKDGVQEGDNVVLNPLAAIQEAQDEAALDMKLQQEAEQIPTEVEEKEAPKKESKSVAKSKKAAA